jgi:glycolate oxidase iron-sulfur subunit
LTQAGFEVRDIPEGHLCCGSAGTYNILEPEIAARLRDRKIANIFQFTPDLVATGNIGCIAQIASGTSIPVLHTIELLDRRWRTNAGCPREPCGLNVASAKRPEQMRTVAWRRERNGEFCRYGCDLRSGPHAE